MTEFGEVRMEHSVLLRSHLLESNDRRDLDKECVRRMFLLAAHFTLATI